MTNENKIASMDAVGEMYDMGNLLLQEFGYPHLPNPVFVPEKKADAWNDAGTKPDHPCLCRTRVYETDWPEFYNYWNGNFWGLTTSTKQNAIENKDVQTTETNIQWREVQP